MLLVLSQSDIYLEDYGILQFLLYKKVKNFILVA